MHLPYLIGYQQDSCFNIPYQQHKKQYLENIKSFHSPALGDAELVASCHTNDDTILVETGSIDDKKCQEKIVDIMEGGPEAFNRRKTIYHLWRAG